MFFRWTCILWVFGVVVAQDIFQVEHTFLTRKGPTAQLAVANVAPNGREVLAPSLSPPTFCTDEQPGWPRFNSQSDLQNNTKWATYFQLVYGQVPSNAGDYPICIGSFRLLYLGALNQAGISQSPVWEKCPSKAGELFMFMDMDRSGSHPSSPSSVQTPMAWSGVMIYHPTQTALASNTWAEIVHSASPSEYFGGWYYYTTGSAVWLWMGNTTSFSDHRDGAKHFLGADYCHAYDWNCNYLNNQTFQTACSQGVQTVQYLHHDDWCFDGVTTMVIEIVDACGSGVSGCGSRGWKSGWSATQDCSCQDSFGAYNCQGGIPSNLF